MLTYRALITLPLQLDKLEDQSIFASLRRNLNHHFIASQEWQSPRWVEERVTWFG